MNILKTIFIHQNCEFYGRWVIFQKTFKNILSAKSTIKNSVCLLLITFPVVYNLILKLSNTFQFTIPTILFTTYGQLNRVFLNDV